MTPGQPITIPEDFKADDLSVEQVKAFLDDLARISWKHGIVVSGLRAEQFRLTTRGDDFGGYVSRQLGQTMRAWSFERDFDALSEAPNFISSVRFNELSAHERIKIIGGQS